MRVECAELSLSGRRDTNQDRVASPWPRRPRCWSPATAWAVTPRASAAAEIAQQTVIERFWQTHAAAARSARIPAPGAGRRARQRASWLRRRGCRSSCGRAPPARSASCSRPRPTGRTSATAASTTLRAGRVLERTRDHSHVELLVREGVISAGQMQNHPMRNFVESCLGGEPILPEMALSTAPRPAAGRRAAGVHRWLLGQPRRDRDRQRVRRRSGCRCRIRWRALSAQAVLNAGGGSDNTSVGGPALPRIATERVIA